MHRDAGSHACMHAGMRDGWKEKKFSEVEEARCKIERKK